MLRILITAGPTREPIDSVRFISNRSSGRMGLELAAAAREAGHEVTLLLGPIGALPTLPAGVRLHRFESSAELKQLLDAHWTDHDCLLMAAAVADFRPAEVVQGKMERGAADELVLRLTPTPDLVALAAQAKRPNQTVVAFALEEPARLTQRAAEKMRRKHVDAIVANPLGTMESQQITGQLLLADGTGLSPGRMGKAGFARWLVEQVARLCRK